MRKGSEQAVALLLALIFGVFAVALFWFAFGTTSSPPPPEKPPETSCRIDDDCAGNPDGLKCLQLYPGDFEPFCGCITNDDCINDRLCGPENKCKEPKVELPPECVCPLDWNDVGCGVAPCDVTEMKQTRVCDPPGCGSEERCTPDLECNLHVFSTPTGANVMVVDKDFWRRGDVNWDGIVNETDNDLIELNFGLADPDYDIDESGSIDLDDCIIVIGNFGATAPWYLTEFTTKVTEGKCVLYGENPNDPSDVLRKEVIIPSIGIVDIEFDFSLP